MKYVLKHILVFVLFHQYFYLKAQVDVELHYSSSQNIYYSGSTSYYIDNKLQVAKRMIVRESQDPRFIISRFNDTVFLLRLIKVNVPDIHFEVNMYDTLFKDTIRYDFYSKEFPVKKVPRLNELFHGDTIKKANLEQHLKKGIGVLFEADLSIGELRRMEKVEGGKVIRMDVRVQKDTVNPVRFSSKSGQFSSEQIGKILAVQAPFNLFVGGIKIRNNNSTEYSVEPIIITVIE